MHVRAASEQSPCLCAAFGCKRLQARERPSNRLSNDSGAQREQRAPEPSDSGLHAALHPQPCCVGVAGSGRTRQVLRARSRRMLRRDAPLCFQETEEPAPGHSPRRRVILRSTSKSGTPRILRGASDQQRQPEPRSCFWRNAGHPNLDPRDLAVLAVLRPTPPTEAQASAPMGWDSTRAAEGGRHFSCGGLRA